MFLIEELNGRDYRIDVVSEVYSPLAVLFLIIFSSFTALPSFYSCPSSVGCFCGVLILWFVWFEKFYAKKSKICMVDTFFGLIHNNY